MRRDHQPPTADTRHHPHERKEWDHQRDHEHPMRAPGRGRRAYGVRSQEAERQIRELRARY